MGAILSEKGFTALGVNAVARKAGVDKVLIYRYFGGMEQLMEAFARDSAFWPSVEELAGGDTDAYACLSLGEKLSQLAANYAHALRSRPLTLEIMAWEMVERNHLTDELEEGPRNEFFYFSDDGLLVGVRHKQWKLVFAEQRARTFRVWSEPFVQLRIPKPFNLRSDPFERADTDSNNYDRWWIERSAFSVTAIQEIVGEFIGTFEDFAGPGYDLHLVQLEGPVAEHVGVAAGMSGSPVLLAR